MEGDLLPLLRARGIEVRTTYPRESGRCHGEHYEYDILAANGEEVVVVEVKTTLWAEDATHFKDSHELAVPPFQRKLESSRLTFLMIRNELSTGFLLAQE